MRKNKLAFDLIEMGLKAETLANLTESQLRLLYKKLNEGKKETEEATTTYSKDENIPAVKVDPKKVTKNSDGSVSVEETNEAKKKKKSKKYNPWAICTSQVGRKDKKKYERCVMDVKKSIKEGKDPIDLFLENKILSLLETQLPPRITKREFLQMISETQTQEKEKVREKDAPSKPGKTKPDKDTPNRPKYRPAPQANNLKEFLGTETAPAEPKPQTPTKPGKTKPDKNTPLRPKYRPAPQARTKNLFPWDEVSRIADEEGYSDIANYIN